MSKSSEFRGEGTRGRDLVRSPRLFVDAALAGGAELACNKGQANYLINVLRLGTGAEVAVFNGHDGEWLAEVRSARRGSCSLLVREQLRAQELGPDIHHLFAPLKKARLDYMVQKATEMGVAALRPVLTQRTVAERVNLTRMRANAIEAAEQCGILWVPRIEEPVALAKLLSQWDENRTLIFCDERAPLADPVAALARVPGGPLAVLIGPEGGFSEQEQGLILSRPFAYPISLGPRVMRADTAAVAALALVNAVLGDWREPSRPCNVRRAGP